MFDKDKILQELDELTHKANNAESDEERKSILKERQKLKELYFPLMYGSTLSGLKAKE